MKITNYWSSTPVLFRKIGDAILVGSISISTYLMDAPIDEKTRYWVCTALNIFGVVGKIITNFFKDDSVSTSQTQPEQPYTPGEN